VAGFLDDEVASESACRLYDHLPDAVRCNALEQRLEAWPSINRIGSADCRVVESVNDFNAICVGVGVHRSLLSLQAVFVRADVRCA
jgi:hypothetical protein